MSLVVKLKQFHLAKCKGDKIAKVDFRGVSHVSRIIEDQGVELILVDERFEWPVGRAIDSSELLTIELLSHSRLFANRVLGSYGLVLQRLIRDGRLCVTDTLLDANNKPLPATVQFEVQYTSPGSTRSSFSTVTPYDETLDDDQQMLIDIEQNIANLERTMTSAADTSRQNSVHDPERSRRPELRRGESTSAAERATSVERKRSSALRSVRSLIRLGKQRPPSKCLSFRVRC